MKLCAALLFATYFAVPAHALTLDATDPSALAEAMQEEGFRAKLSTDNVGDPKIEGKNGKTDYSIFFYGCKDGKNCTTIQFSVGYDMSNGMSYEWANEWNRTNRFGAINLDDEMDPYLQFDMVLSGGVTPKNFTDTLNWWHIAMDEFEDFVDW